MSQAENLIRLGEFIAEMLQNSRNNIPVCYGVNNGSYYEIVSNVSLTFPKFSWMCDLQPFSSVDNIKRFVIPFSSRYKLYFYCFPHINKNTVIDRSLNNSGRFEEILDKLNIHELNKKTIDKIPLHFDVIRGNYPKIRSVVSNNFSDI